MGLRDAHRQLHSSTSTTVSVGDIVLVHDKDHPRGFWKMAKVQKLIVGTDGQIRGAVLKVADKSGRPITLQRPVQLLYPLGVSQAETEPSDEVDARDVTGSVADDNPDSAEDEEAPTIRPPPSATELCLEGT